VAVVAQQLDGTPGGGVVEPPVDLGEVAAVERRREQKCREQVGGRAGPEVPASLSVSVLDLLGEVHRQACCLPNCGDARERVEREAAGAACDALGIEHPAGSANASKGVCGHEEVGLVGGGNDRAGGIEDHGDGEAGGLAGSGRHDAQHDVLPGAAQQRAVGLEDPERQAGVLGSDGFVGREAGSQRPGSFGGGFWGERGKVRGSGKGSHRVVGERSTGPPGGPDSGGDGRAHPDADPSTGDQWGGRTEHRPGSVTEHARRCVNGKRGWIPATVRDPPCGAAGGPGDAGQGKPAPEGGDDGQRGGHLRGHPGTGAERRGPHYPALRIRASVS
jgi:hypothetical protein